MSRGFDSRAKYNAYAKPEIDLLKILTIRMQYIHIYYKVLREEASGNVFSHAQTLRKNIQVIQSK